MSKNKELKELNPLSFSKSLEKPQFKSVISNLSARAKRVLNDLRIESIDDFLSLRSVDLERAWSCGKKTASEIKKLQDSLSKNIENEPPTNEPFAAIAPVSFENTPKDIFDSIQQQLNARSLNILEDLGITNLESFMRLNKKQLLKCRNCGRKTVNEIISMQEGIADYAQAIVDKFGEFKPRELLTAPCLFTVGSPGKNTLSTKDVFVDVDNPSNWLIEWVINLAKSENQAKAFMLRKGMLGSAPMTLEAVGEQVGGVTRERVRQMDMALEQAASSPLQQHRLLPIIKKLNEIVDQHGGFISLEELTHAALCKGKNGDQLRFAWDLIVFFSTLKVWIESGLEIKNTGIIRNRTSRIVISKLSKIFEKIVCSESDDFEDDCCWSIECGHLKATLLKKCSNIDGLQQIENVSDTLLDALINGFKGRVKLKNNRLYSKSLWHFRFGKITKFLDILLKKTEKPSHFTQIAQRARKWRPDLSDYNVHSTLDRMESAWLWDSGTFVHKDNVVIPFSLIHDVENWLIEALNSDTPFVSVNGAYINFQNRCKRANLPSEISLYTCLRQAANTDLLYPRLPFVYLRSGFTERVPVYVALERFIRDSGGPVSQQEVKNYCMEKIYLKEYQFYQVSQLVSNVIRTADWGYLHFDNVELNQESAAPLIQYTQEVLEKEGHCSIEKIYRDKIVTCRSIGINGPVMLYSVLQSFAGESLSMDRFPQLAKRNGAEIGVGQPVSRLPPHSPLRAELPHKVPQNYSLRRSAVR